MNPNIVKYKLFSVEPTSSDEPLPCLNSISLNLTTADGKYLEFKIDKISSRPISLMLKGEKKMKVELDDIVSIESPTEPTHQKSNNKIVYFTNRKPGVLVDFTASRDIQKKLHLSTDEMVEVYRGIYVNKSHIKKFDGKFLLVKTFGDTKPHKIPISRTHKKIVLDIIKTTQ